MKPDIHRIPTDLIDTTCAEFRRLVGGQSDFARVAQMRLRETDKDVAQSKQNECNPLKFKNRIESGKIQPANLDDKDEPANDHRHLPDHERPFRNRGRPDRIDPSPLQTHIEIGIHGSKKNDIDRNRDTAYKLW